MALSIAYSAGFRVGEVAMLEVRDIDSERMLIRVERGKGGLHCDGWLFPGQHALKPISTKQLYRIIVEAAQVAEIARRVGPHSLRHSFATHIPHYP